MKKKFRNVLFKKVPFRLENISTEIMNQHFTSNFYSKNKRK